jgi:ubiquinone biosynthesis protein
MTLLGISLGELAVRTLLAGAIAVVTTSASLRLLGVRRGWAMALLAALVGWAAGFSLALGLSSWDWDAEGLITRAVALAIPLTMGVAVTLDLLARPGSLAVGDRAGLVVAPRPLRAVGTRVSVLRRSRELVRLARREGFGPFLSPARRVSRTVDDPGVRIRRVLEQAGGVYIKLGQIAATRVDLLPKEICDELSKLQNRPRPSRSSTSSPSCAPSSVRTSTGCSSSSTRPRSLPARSARRTSRCSGRENGWW